MFIKPLSINLLIPLSIKLLFYQRPSLSTLSLSNLIPSCNLIKAIFGITVLSGKMKVLKVNEKYNER